MGCLRTQTGFQVQSLSIGQISISHVLLLHKDILDLLYPIYQLLFIDNETCVFYIFIEIIPVNDFHQVNLQAFRMYFSL